VPQPRRLAARVRGKSLLHQAGEIKGVVSHQSSSSSREEFAATFTLAATITALRVEVDLGREHLVAAAALIDGADVQLSNPSAATADPIEGRS
jgi:hypothetical protein